MVVKMKHTLCLALLFALVIGGSSAYESLRVAAKTRGAYLDAFSSKELGGSVHECYRTCVPGDVRTCYYSFTVTEFLTMSSFCGDCPYKPEDCFNIGCITAGGHVRPVSVANHMLPGPSIQVCEGDIVQVNVRNIYGSESTTIHWHGMHQVDTPYMDGVPFLTQCPVHPYNTFLYNFTATPAGTHMWHSHSGVQEADGLYGAFIVREANDPLSAYYDFDLPEHFMKIWQWFDSTTAAALKLGLYESSAARGLGFTVNGLAAKEKFERDGTIHYTPRESFTVTQGSRYRFRSLASTAVYCPIQISVDHHTLLVIASDGRSFEPVEVDSFIINAGERYDFVLTADQEVGNYWIRFRGLGECASNAVSTEAILQYEGADDNDPPEAIGYDQGDRPGVLLNPVEQTDRDYSHNSLIRIVDLNSTVSDPEDISGTPDHVFYIPFSVNSYRKLGTPGTYSQFNNVSFDFPRIPLLTQYEEITDDMFCTEDNDDAKDCYAGYCACPYIYSVDHGSLVELVFIDLSNPRTENHPLHFHGHYFHVVAMEHGDRSITVDDVKRRNEAGLIDKKLEGAPIKDTVGIPDHGFGVLRFIASNPGYWFLHCHVTAHTAEGMAIVIKVGEHSEMVQRPSNFPTCGNYDITASS